MSRTWNTTSVGAFKRREAIGAGGEYEYWWQHPDAAYSYFQYYGQPRDRRSRFKPPTPRGVSRTRRELRRHYWHGERFKVKTVLRRFDTPEPTRHRHALLWED